MTPKNSLRIWVRQVREVSCNPLILLAGGVLREVREVCCNPLILLAGGCGRCVPSHSYMAAPAFWSRAHHQNLGPEWRVT